MRESYLKKLEAVFLFLLDTSYLLMNIPMLLEYLTPEMEDGSYRSEMNLKPYSCNHYIFFCSCHTTCLISCRASCHVC